MIIYLLHDFIFIEKKNFKKSYSVNTHSIIIKHLSLINIHKEKILRTIKRTLVSFLSVKQNVLFYSFVRLYTTKHIYDCYLHST